MNPRLSTLVAYLIVGAFSLSLSVGFASWLLRPARSQDAAAPATAAGQVPPAAGGVSPERTAELQENVSFLEPYVFDLREGRRNPFQVPVVIDENAMDLTVPGSPLERYELDELKLVGILWDIRSPKAMIIDPVGEVHVLSKDDRIGRKRGYIATIREGEVVVVEMSNFNGENTLSTRVMRIDR